MATLVPTLNFQPRSSAETERRHLLADSVAPSEAASMILDLDQQGDRTPRARSPAPSSTSTQQPAAPAAAASNERRGTIADPSSTPRPYKGFPSEAAYLAALMEWAESKKYIHYDTSLQGFYGEKTMQEYADQPKLEGLGLRKKWRARKERKEEERRGTDRRNTVA